MKRIAKERDEFTKACWHLGNQVFSCQRDAEKSAEALNKKYHYPVASYRIIPIEKYECKGRPNPLTPKVTQYKIVCSLAEDNEANKQPRGKPTGYFNV